MIPVTRLDGTPMIVNSDQIAWIECNPDTVVSLMGGEKLIVRESPEILVERVVEFKRTIADSTRARLCTVNPPSPGSSAIGFRSSGPSGRGEGTDEFPGEEGARSW